MATLERWIVHKFGGSSVADADCFARVATLLESLPPGPLAVVLSACRGVTDALLGLVSLAERQDDAFIGEIARLRERHAQIADTLLTTESARLYLAGFDRDCQDLEGILRTVKLTRSAAREVSDLIAGYGEIWSTQIFYKYFEERARRAGAVQWVDARRVVTVEWGSLGPAVQWSQSHASLAEVVEVGFTGTLIITGFIASKARGVQTTLGRNGSDFSASIFGALLDAREIHIWTDVDGVLSADPRRVPDATVIDSLSYNEAMELAYFGAKVIHPQTMAPAVGGAIPDLDPQHLRAAEAGNPHLRAAAVAPAGEGHHQHRAHGARQSRGRRHDRRARHGAPALWRAARRGHLGHSHFAG